MTESEIMKALEVCGKDEPCETCPAKGKFYNDEFRCCGNLMIIAIDLLNRKNAEIEDLKNQLSIFKKLLDKAEARIHMYKHYDEERDIRLHSRLTETARAEAIKEFAERVNNLIDMCFYDLGDFDDNMSMKTDVDQIAKEMGVE